MGTDIDDINRGYEMAAVWMTPEIGSRLPRRSPSFVSSLPGTTAHVRL